MPPKRKSPPAPTSPPRRPPPDRSEHNERNDRNGRDRADRDRADRTPPSGSGGVTPPLRTFPEIRDEREYYVDGPWGWDVSATHGAPSPLELLYRWLEVPGNWERFHDGGADARKVATEELSEVIQRESGARKSWIDCEVKLIDIYRVFNIALEEETATGFNDDGRPRLGSLILSAEVSAKDDKARHYSTGLLSHVGAQLNKICGGLDYRRLKETFGETAAKERAHGHGHGHHGHGGHGGHGFGFGHGLGDQSPHLRPGHDRPRSHSHGQSYREGSRRDSELLDRDRLLEFAEDGLPGPPPDFEESLMRSAPPRGYDAVEDAARDAALAAYRATKAAALSASRAKERQFNAEEMRQRAILDMAKLAHDIDPSLRPIVAHRTALTMYISQRQALGEL